MNKHIFSLTLLISAPTVLLSSTAVSQKNLFLDAGVLVTHEWVTKLYYEGKLSENSAAHTRLKNIPADDRICIILKADALRIRNGFLTEQDALNEMLQSHAYDTAYKYAAQYVNETRAKSLADSIKGNVRTAIRNNNNCSGYDIAGQFGYQQQVKIINSIKTDGTGRNNTNLPSGY